MPEKSIVLAGNIPSADQTQNKFGYVNPSGLLTKHYWLVYWWFINHT